MKGQLSVTCSSAVKELNLGLPQCSWAPDLVLGDPGTGRAGGQVAHSGRRGAGTPPARGGAARTRQAGSRSRGCTHLPGALPIAAASAMGNIQKKLMGRSEGGRRSRRSRTQPPRAEQPGGPRETETAGRSTDNPHPGEPRASQDPGDLKSQGNELFRSGQFAEAAAQYSAAIAQLEPAGRGAEPGHGGVTGLSLGCSGRGSGQKPASRAR